MLWITGDTILNSGNLRRKILSLLKFEFTWNSNPAVLFAIFGSVLLANSKSISFSSSMLTFGRVQSLAYTLELSLAR